MSLDNERATVGNNLLILGIILTIYYVITILNNNAYIEGGISNTL